LSIHADMPAQHRFAFPDSDLMSELVRHYFQEDQIYYPILHRPSFEHAIASGQHLRDNGFAGVLLLVCALGSRYTNDPRVFIHGAPTQSAGWKWYSQVQMIRKSPLAAPRLHDVQQYAVSHLIYLGEWRAFDVRICDTVGIHLPHGQFSTPCFATHDLFRYPTLFGRQCTSKEGVQRPRHSSNHRGALETSILVSEGA
jgi:hypothetical protein